MSSGAAFQLRDMVLQNKALIGTSRNTTAGGDTSYTFKLQPGGAYYVRVRDYYSDGAGDYTLTLDEETGSDG